MRETAMASHYRRSCCWRNLLVTSSYRREQRWGIKPKGMRAINFGSGVTSGSNRERASSADRIVFWRPRV
jgi:hypothetical protein